MNVPIEFKTKLFKKGEVLVRKGEITRYGYRVVKGCLRSYVVDKTDKEHIIQFAPEEWIITDMNSLMNNQPAQVYIDALEDTEVILLDKSKMKLYEEQITKLELMEQRSALMRNIIALNKRLALLLGASAEERYLDFIDTYPGLAQRITLKYIAAYLGITPEYLSEVRRRLAQK